ncbi:dTDP-4-dehydrorhamnose 3,5-epimerase [Amylibacter sp. SFDW26]|uniref:dTDP-4-dehydrorhamnose 3,5-epimerase n=1 Tax=Amylibacter sp. SFDW26 TaxID=2652722 RepID=UPI001261F00F|nr:dTDP-4-dehydrorhamnose 3,5-epimerase [Amylibacter sp. SFDW26]KAB7610081.1 dTDP-4-dehydrorhamnose 3,5-epimerase [Amylibacter sp. SFDW26]
MIFEALEIDGAYKITPNKLGDSRGAFARVFCMEEFQQYNLEVRWVQMNTSINATKGTIRGLHYQRPPYAETKLVRCVRGKVFDVFVDLRKDSPSYGAVCTVELDSAALEMVYIPKGCAHGFQTLTDDVEMHYCHSAFYKPDHEAGVNIKDPKLAIKWPLPFSVLSDKDQNHPIFETTEPITL